jgi:hypothetical protein
MTRGRRIRGIVAVLTAVAGAALATTAQGDADASSAPPAARTSGASHVTHLRLHVTGCERCSVQLQQAVTGRPTVWQSARQRIGGDHVAAFTVRSGRTHGMSIVLRAPWEGDTGAVPNVVTRYAGQPVGAFVSRTDARHSPRAAGCWAGTDADAVRLDLHVARVPAKTLDGHDTSIPLVYATHTLPSWKPYVRTFKGTIGNQDAFYCTRP